MAFRIYWPRGLVKLELPWIAGQVVSSLLANAMGQHLLVILSDDLDTAAVYSVIGKIF